MSIDPDDPVIRNERPFAGLQRALEEGRLSLKPDDTPRVRTAFPDYTGISSFGRKKSKKKTILVLHLEDGDVVHLEIRRSRDELPEEITRVPADPR